MAKKKTVQFVICDLYPCKHMFRSDYYRVELLEKLSSSRTKLAEFGDAYHDRGKDKAEGFAWGYVYAKYGKDTQVKLVYEEREDETLRQDYGCEECEGESSS